MTIEQVLASRGLLGALAVRGASLVGACPIHGGDNKTAFVVHRRRNLWKCFTLCQAGGDIIDLVRRLDGCGFRRAAQVLAAIEEQTTCSVTSPLLRRVRTRPSTFRPYSVRRELDPKHRFFEARGITVATASRFEVGSWPGPGMCQGCIAVRLHQTDGTALGYAGRRLRPDHRGKWVFPPHLPKSQLLYGYHHLHTPSTPLVVVEGPWDVLRLYQLGTPAVALLGTHLSNTQRLQLTRSNHLTVMLDGDRAGRIAGRSIAERLGANLIALEDGKDPADLTDTELREVLFP